MRKIPQSLKLFLVLILSTVYVVSFSHFGVKAYTFFTSNQPVFPAGTSLASVSLAGVTEDEALTKINSKIVSWKKNTKIILEYNNKSISLDSSFIRFNLRESLQNLKDGQNVPLGIAVNENSLVKALNAFSPNVSLEQINVQKLIIQISSHATELVSDDMKLNLEDFLSDKSKQIVLSKAVVDPDQVPDDLMTAIDKLNSIDVKAQSTFSLLEYLGKQKMQDFSSSSLSIIASGIYQAILKTNFAILERNTSQTVPDYTSPGFEANVDAENNNDFVFANPNKNSFQIKLEWLPDGMHVALIGKKLLTTYEVNTRNIQYFSPKTIVQYSPIVEPGQVKVEAAGKKGILVKVYRKEYQDGLIVNNNLISEDFYPPIPRVEIHPLIENNSTDSSQSNQTDDGQSVKSNTPSSNETGQTVNQANSDGTGLRDNNSSNNSTNQSTVSSAK